MLRPPNGERIPAAAADDPHSCMLAITTAAAERLRRTKSRTADKRRLQDIQ